MSTASFCLREPFGRAICIFCMLCVFLVTVTNGILFFPRGGSFGLLAALAVPIELPNRNVYMAFNFESNYGLPSNNSYNEWIDRWDLDEHFLGIGSNVTPIDGRAVDQKLKRAAPSALPGSLTRHAFYRSFVHYMGQFGLNGRACLLRLICEVSAEPLDAHNGALGSIFKILFMPTTSMAESPLQHVSSIYEASWLGTRGLGCADYSNDCEHSVLDMISIMH